MARPNRKAELYALVDTLFEKGLKSTTLLAEALNLSPERCRQILIDLGKHRPNRRRSLQDHLGGLDPELVQRVTRFARRWTPEDDQTEETVATATEEPAEPQQAA